MTTKRNTPRRNNQQYSDLSKALRRKASRTNAPCWLCGQPIDYELPWKHPMSYTADHVQPLAAGGKIRGELRPAHRSCNSRRGAGRTQSSNITPPEITSRAW